MATAKSVIIIGAGASKEVGMPVGNELKRHIAHLLDFKFERGFQRISGDQGILNSLRLHIERARLPEGALNQYIADCRYIHDAMPQENSIDDFIHRQEGNAATVLCGKLAIARAILNAERQSKLCPNIPAGERRPNLEVVETTWFTRFIQLLNRNCTLSELRDRLSQLIVINFNYDRCLEYFLFNALQLAYRLADERAAELVATLPIYHPYGSVGKLPWQASSGSVHFGQELSDQQLLDAAQRINTFTEGTNAAKSDIDQIHQGIWDSANILFLGFAYHEQNLKLLNPRRPLPAGVARMKSYMGTGLGISGLDLSIVQSDVRKIFDPQRGDVTIEDATCFDLFNRYSRTLARRFWGM